jgi:hypothetical protein
VDLLDMPPVLHDLDGDGIGDAAVLLAESSGGSGTFTHLSESSAGGELQIPGLIQLGETFRFIPAAHPMETRRVTS